jgi:hypothetical protein
MKFKRGFHIVVPGRYNAAEPKNGNERENAGSQSHAWKKCLPARRRAPIYTVFWQLDPPDQYYAGKRVQQQGCATTRTECRCLFPGEREF